MAAQKMLPKDFLLDNGKYQFQQSRSYKWKNSWQLDNEYIELSEEPVTWDSPDGTASIWKSSDNGVYNPSGIDVSVNFSSDNSGGAYNLDFQINNSTTEIFYFNVQFQGYTFNFKLITKLQYKKTTDQDWTDCSSINDMYKLNLSDEISDGSITTPNDTPAVNNIKYFRFFTLPSDLDYNYFLITGIEWRNGTAVRGNIMTGIVYIDAIPPTQIGNVHLITPIIVAHGTHDTDQRNNLIPPHAPIPKGTNIGVYIQNSDTAARFRCCNTGKADQAYKNAAYSTTISFVDNTAFGLDGNYQLYLKIYYIGIK